MVSVILFKLARGKNCNGTTVMPERGVIVLEDSLAAPVKSIQMLFPLTH